MSNCWKTVSKVRLQKFLPTGGDVMTYTMLRWDIHSAGQGCATGDKYAFGKAEVVFNKCI